MKVLNLYAGLGGNRKLWTDVQVTAVELMPEVADFYKAHFTDDEVIVTDAHQYLLNHFKEYDFIWSSRPCPTHSRARFWRWGSTKPVYPDMALYEEILLLKHYYKGKWVVENVVPYYQPLIPGKKIGRHLFWSNFSLHGVMANHLKNFNSLSDKEIANFIGFDLDRFKYKGKKTAYIRNCVDPLLGKVLLERARKTKQTFF